MSIVIQRISETKRGRFALFAEDEFLFSIDDETLVRFHVQVGSSFTSEELSCLRQESETKKAKEQAIRFLSLRAYGEKELYTKLCRKFDEYSCAAAMATLHEIGLLDDTQFAYDKAKGMASRGKSSTEIKRKLYELGIDRELAAAAAEEYADDDLQNAVSLLSKMYIEKLRKGETQKVIAALARRGFNYGITKQAIEVVKEEFELDETSDQLEDWYD